MTDEEGMIADLEEKIEELEDELALWKIESYFCFKPGTTIQSVCYNFESKLCAKCKQPECDLAGWKQPKGHISRRRRRSIKHEDVQVLADELGDE